MKNGAPAAGEPVEGDFLRVARNWSIWSAVGVFLIYGCGYLSLRFRLLSLGVMADFGAFGERTFYAGAMFWFHTMLTLSSMLAIIILIGIIPGLAWFKGRRKNPDQPGMTERMTSAVSRSVQASPYKWYSFALLFSMGWPQFYLRKIVQFRSILLDPTERTDIFSTLPKAGDLAKEFYFMLLLFALLLSGGLYAVVRKNMPKIMSSGWLLAILFFMICVQAALIPIHHGQLVARQTFMSLIRISGEKLPAGRKAWLLWEGETILSFFVKDSTESGISRGLLVSTKEEASPMESGHFHPLDSLLSNRF